MLELKFYILVIIIIMRSMNSECPAVQIVRLVVSMSSSSM
jgi:hypothetical protein